MKKELSMEARLLLAFLLMGVVLLVSQYFIKPAPAPVATKAGAQAERPAGTRLRRLRPLRLPLPFPSPKGAEAGAQVQGYTEQTSEVDTDLFHVVFTNRGAVVRS